MNLEKYPEIGYWRGRRIDELTKDELVKAMMQLAQYYESRLESEKHTYDFRIEMLKRQS